MLAAVAFLFYTSLLSDQFFLKDLILWMKESVFLSSKISLISYSFILDRVSVFFFSPWSAALSSFVVSSSFFWPLTSASFVCLSYFSFISFNLFSLYSLMAVILASHIWFWAANLDYNADELWTRLWLRLVASEDDSALTADFWVKDCWTLALMPLDT